MVMVNGGALAVDFAAGSYSPFPALSFSHLSFSLICYLLLLRSTGGGRGSPSAVVEAFNLGAQGSRALAALLFGDENRYKNLPRLSSIPLFHAPLPCLSFMPFPRAPLPCLCICRWGKLPVTIYPNSYDKAQDLANYDMAKAPGEWAINRLNRLVRSR
jgi:hypothetical protein